MEHVTTMFNSNASCFELSWVGLGFDKNPFQTTVSPEDTIPYLPTVWTYIQDFEVFIFRTLSLEVVNKAQQVLNFLTSREFQPANFL